MTADPYAELAAILDAEIDRTVDPETARRIREVTAANKAVLDEHRQWLDRQAAEIDRRAREYASAFEAVFAAMIEMEQT